MKCVFQDPADSHIQIVEGHLTDFRKALRFASGRLNIVSDKNDLLQSGHIRTAGGMPHDGTEYVIVIHPVLHFRKMGSQLGMQKIRRIHFHLGDLQSVVTAHFDLAVIGDAFGAVVEQSGNLGSFDIFPIAHGKGSCRIHHTKGMTIPVRIQFLFHFSLQFKKISSFHRYPRSVCMF